jgi:hypothetical protein
LAGELPAPETVRSHHDLAAVVGVEAVFSFNELARLDGFLFGVLNPDVLGCTIHTELS